MFCVDGTGWGDEVQESIIETKSFLFAVRITKLYKYLTRKKMSILFLNS